MSKKNDTPIAPDEALGKAEEFVLKNKKAFIGVIAAIIVVAALNAFGVFSPKSNENSDAAIEEHKAYICNQVLADSLTIAEVAEGTALEFDGFTLVATVEKV